MDPITPFDVERMLWGTAPALFYLEILVRVAVIWLWTICLLRWVGGRSISQMSVVEFLLVIALGSAVGDPMFQPDVPLLHAMLVILLVVLSDKAVDFAFRRWTKAKRLVDGTPTRILRDGHLSKAGMEAQGVGATEVMEMLRVAGIRNLGQVEHAFMEPSGRLSVFPYRQPRPGLSIVPPLELQDLAPPPTPLAPPPAPPPAPASPCCCTTCGTVRPAEAPQCPECGETKATRPQTADAASPSPDD